MTQDQLIELAFIKCSCDFEVLLYTFIYIYVYSIYIYIYIDHQDLTFEERMTAT